MDALVKQIKALPKAEGIEEVLVPGEPERRTYERRRCEGFSLPDGNVRNLIAADQQLDLEVPNWLQAI
jgi:LDH2 family malate/lactate/ureidoglycolate dehydrogenase